MTDGRASPVLDRLRQRLDAADVSYSVREHAAVFTSAEAASVRGTSLASGAKALLCKGDDVFCLLVMPADRRLAGVALRRARGWKRLRFATPDELLTLTGLAPGAVPPFGSLFDLPTLCDRGLLVQSTINFNAGDHATSIAMTCAAYLAFELPELGDFATPPPEA